MRAWIGVCQRSYALEVSDRRRFVVSGRLESTVAHPLIWRKDNTSPLLARFVADVQLLPELGRLHLLHLQVVEGLCPDRRRKHPSWTRFKAHARI